MRDLAETERGIRMERDRGGKGEKKKRRRAGTRDGNMTKREKKETRGTAMQEKGKESG